MTPHTSANVRINATHHAHVSQLAACAILKAVLRTNGGPPSLVSSFLGLTRTHTYGPMEKTRIPETCNTLRLE